MSDNPLSDINTQIELKVLEFEPNLSSKRGYENRKKWRRGMSGCQRCQAKLMYLLSTTPTLSKIEKKLHEKHPEIKNIRKYTKNVIREVTGWGIFDDYIYENKLWPLREPILAPPEIHYLLRKKWRMLEVYGKTLIKEDRKIKRALDSPSKTGDLLRAALSRVRVK